MDPFVAGVAVGALGAGLALAGLIRRLAVGRRRIRQALESAAATHLPESMSGPQQAEVEDALRRAGNAHALIAHAVEDATDAIAIANPDGRHVFHNRAFTRLLGYTSWELTALGPSEIFVSPPGGREIFETLRAGGSFVGEIELRAKDGRVVPFLLRADAVRSASGEIVGMIGIHTGIAHRRAHEQALASAREDALRVAQMKTDFLMNVSHELRTPLNAILGLADVLAGELRDVAATPAATDSVQTIRRSAESLMAIVEDVLAVAAIEAGELVLDRTPFDLRALLAGVVASFEEGAEIKGLRLASTCTVDRPVRLGDPRRIRQILGELAGNAVKFTPAGSVSISIDDAPDLGGTAAVALTVHDTGVGIPRELVAKLFQPFQQGDGSSTRAFGGVGIGLCLCRKLTELLGGSIGVESEPGKGSTFRVVLPLPSAPADMRPGAFERAMRDEPPVAPLPPPAVQVITGAGDASRGEVRAHVLLVDDHPVNRMVGQRMLARLGCSVTAAPGGAEALELFDAQPFDLVLMDLQMPGMDGVAATRALRALDGRQVPVIALTASASDTDRARCLAAGMDGFLSKPVQIDELRALIDAWIVPATTPA